MKTTHRYLTGTLLFLLCMTSCEKEEMPPEELSWAGDWVASMVLRDGIFTEIPTTIDGIWIEPIYFTINIEEGTSGSLTGTSFRNVFSSSFELSPNKQVTFGPLGGTRVQEEKWGGAVLDNILITKTFKVRNDSLYFQHLDYKTLILFTKPQ